MHENCFQVDRCKSDNLAAILFMQLGSQDLKIPLGNRVFRIQHTQIKLKSPVPNFYFKNAARSL